MLVLLNNVFYLFNFILITFKGYTQRSNINQEEEGNNIKHEAEINTEK